MTPNSLDPRWDNQTLNYDLEKHNWPAYWLAVAKEKFSQIEALETIHEILKPSEILELGRYLQKACDGNEFQDRADAYYGEYVYQLSDGEEWMLQRQVTIRMVIPNQEKAGRLL